MDNHRRIWHRFVSRLRCSRGTHSYIPSSVIGSRNISNSSPAVGVSFSSRYSRFVRDNNRSRPRLQIASNSYWSFTNPIVRLPQGGKIVSFTPKCLSGLNVETILSGQASYDDFSQNCWLENHLHRFGGLNVEEVTTENSSNVAGSEIGAQVASENESDNTSYSNNVMSVTTAVSIWNNRRTNSNTYSSSSSSFISSSISDITHTYLAGFAFDPDSIFPEAPPPYSELNNDPPPPYAEIPNSTASSSQNNRHSSNYGLDFHDILW